MYGSDVFAVITAHDQKHKASSALELEHNSRWFCKAIENVTLKLIMNSREITPVENSQSNDEKKKIINNVNRLIVSFSKLLALNNFENELQLSTNSILFHIFLRHREMKKINNRQISSIVVMSDSWSTQNLMKVYCERDSEYLTSRLSLDA